MELSRKKQEAYNDIVELFKARLAKNAEECLECGHEMSAQGYRKILQRLDKQGHLHGFSDTWASDAFAFAFNEHSSFPREWYFDFYEKMFARKLT